MKINPAPLHLAQAIVVGLSAVLSIAVLGTSAHTLDVFNKQQTSNPWWLPLWPDHFDVHGTKALVGASTASFVLSVVFLVAVLVPRVSVPHIVYRRRMLIDDRSSTSSISQLCAPSWRLVQHCLPLSSPWSPSSTVISSTTTAPRSILSKLGRANTRGPSRFNKIWRFPQIWEMGTSNLFARRAYVSHQLITP